MSMWTHVAAVARIDSFVENDDFSPVFGRECLAGDSREVWNEAQEHPERFLPMGSEGTLQMSVWINPQRNCLARYVVTVFGDLRDYQDGMGVIEWFKEKLKPLWVRQATITVDIGTSKALNWTYDPFETDQEET